MKTVSKCRIILLAIAVCAGFAACGDDDDVDSSKLIGTWGLIHEEGYEECDSNNSEWNDTFDGTDTFTFTDDHRFTDETGESGQWKISGNQLQIAYDDYPDEWDSETIVELSETTLILEYKDDDPDCRFYDKSTYRKQ